MRLPKFDRAATTTLIAASVIATAGAFLLTSRWDRTTAAAPAAVVQKQSPTERPVVELVFALDTTGSMSGLIESAKQKIWSITNQVMSGQPQPEVRVGLVFYRDITDAYVTESFPLTSDIDAVYEKLLTARAEGGGDNPEHVNAALDVAINKMQWKSGDNVLKLVFLVGDAPPHDDYTDSKTSTVLAKEAASKGIIINAIRAGQQGATQIAWRKIAAAAGGEYASIAQDGGTVAVSTPYDSDLARYNRELADSSIGWGSAGDRHKAKMRMDNRRAMSGETAAAAASVSARKGGYLGKGDLLSAADEGDVDIATLPAEEAPAAIAGMDAPARAKWVAEKKAERKEIAKKISETSKKRADYLKKNKSAKADSFDDNVGGMLKKQSKNIGVVVE